MQGWERRSSGGGFGRRICKVGKGAQVENLLFYWFFCASVDVGRFLYLNNLLQAWDPTSFRGFLGLIFPTKRFFEPTVLLLKKAARCHPFLVRVRCLFHNHLRLKRVSLLKIYLNYEFEISLLISHLFFSLFNCILHEQIRIATGMLNPTSRQETVRIKPIDVKERYFLSFFIFNENDSI